MERGGCIYIMTNYQKNTLYIGVTSDLRCRVEEHKTKKHPLSFTAKYDLTFLIYYETFYAIEEAIEREKQLKKWRRAKKEVLISKINHSWNDLSHELSDW